MSLESNLEREEQILESELSSGVIDEREYSKQVRRLHREARAEAREQAENAYDESMYSNGY